MRCFHPTELQARHSSCCAFCLACINPRLSIRITLDMRFGTIFLAAAACVAPLFYTACTACSSKPQSPEQLRQQTAAATATLKEDAKAVAGGVKDGLTRPSSDKPLDLNSASKSQLQTLPGIDAATADRIVAGRPYSSEHELLEKRVVSRDEYSKIADRITVKN